MSSACVLISLALWTYPSAWPTWYSHPGSVHCGGIDYDIAGKLSLFWGFTLHVGGWLCWQLLACSILCFHRQVEMCWNTACRTPVLDFVLITLKLSGVPMLPGNMGTWSPYFYGVPKILWHRDQNGIKRSAFFLCP